MRNKNSMTRKSGVVVGALCGALAFGALPAQMTAAQAAAAAPTKGQFGPVTGLEVAKPTKVGGEYLIDAQWNTLASAVRYNVALLRADGTTVEQTSVVNPAWKVTTTEPVLSRLRVRVIAVNARNKKSRPATVSVRLPDVTAPVASYRTSSEDVVGTITQLSLTDDASTAAQITREVQWTQGGSFEPWNGEATTSHEFPRELAKYQAVVRLTDQANNTSTYPLTVVILDDEAPTGDYTVNRASAWVAPAQPVTVTQVAVADNFSADADIERRVVWGDGTAPQAWADGDTLSHSYTSTGSYSPLVQLTDEAGNETTVPTSAVVVTADTVAPTVTVKVPRKGVRRVAKWRTVRGTASDVDGTGVQTVKMRAVQKRGQRWYAYKGGRKVWVKAGTTKASADRKARPAVVAPTELGTWSHTFGSLRKGKLVVTARSKDRAGNISQPARVSPRLTRR